MYDDVQPVTLVASNSIVGLCLSPLELVRTRLIIQSGSVHRKKYSGAFHWHEDTHGFEDGGCVCGE